jgi:hypothetical protein
MKNYTKKQIRAAFKRIGYKCNFSVNPFNGDLVALDFTDPSGRTTKGSNVFGSDFFSTNKPAFELLALYRGGFLTDSDQRIAK